MYMSVTIYILKKKNIILDCSKCQTLFLGGSKITADDDCSHKIKGHLLLGRKPMTNRDIILKSRGITLLTNVRIVKAMFF